MLWIAGLMAVLAVGLLSLLRFIPLEARAQDEDVGAATESDGPDEFDRLKLREGPEAGEEPEAQAPDEAPSTDAVTAEDAAQEPPIEPDATPDIQPGTVADPVMRAEDEKGEGMDEDTPGDESRGRDAADASDWIASATEQDLAAYDPDEDDLVLVWDDSSGPEPGIHLARDDADPALTNVVMGDVIVAQVRTKDDRLPDHISIVPLSTAQSLGWASG